MRVGILSYPMLFQREGGLQVQVRSTLRSLNALPGMHAELVDPCRIRLDEYDLVHVFAAINGNHRIVEAAVDQGVPVVLSPLVSPGWTRSLGARSRVVERLLGNLTDWQTHTSYTQVQRALQLANVLLALGEAERRAIVSAFLIDEAKVRVIPNGISPHFFEANGDLFRARTGIVGPFVLMVGTISPYKNQLGLAQALAELAMPFVVIGGASDQDYLRRLRAQAGVTWLGALQHDDRLLSSAYAAASVFALPSEGEVFPLTVLEALASGTPVVMTRDSALALPNSAFALRTVQWNDIGAQKRAIMAFVTAPPPRAQVRELVRELTWPRIGRELAHCYEELVLRKTAQPFSQ